MRRLAAAVAALVLLVAGPAPAPAVAEAAPAGVTISGVDAHDGTIYQDGGVYYWVGTMYGCGWRWQDPASPPWCGFGVYTAPALGGPWTFVRTLFDPNGGSGTWKGESWQTICRFHGCFNPRMIRRPGDGVWILWFNAPSDLRRHQANQFWSMGCNSPTGPCGAAAGPPYGGTFKPSIYACNPGGDFSVLVEGADAWLVCALETTRTLSVEKLAGWWGAGSTVGATNLAGLSYVEGTGVARLPSGKLLITYGDNCPYCGATDTSYAVADQPLGPWHTPTPRTRARISGHSCGGQPRTIVELDGQHYQQIDTWAHGQPNQTSAATRLEPLVLTGAPLTGPSTGAPWAGPFAPFTCN